MKIFAVLGIVLLTGAKPVPAKVSEILKDSYRFDGRVVEVKGKVDRFKAKTSQAGRDYYVFDLVDGKEKLPIYGGNRLEKAPKDGDLVTVVGKFAIERKVGSLTFKNEIDASLRQDKTFGVK